MAGSPDSILNTIDFADPALDIDAAYQQAIQEVPGLEQYGREAFVEFVDEYRNAIPAVDEYREHMQGVFDDLKQSNPALFEGAELQIGDIKSPRRALEKIVGDYKGDASKIGDLVRGRIVADTPEQIQAIREYIAEHADEIGIEKMKDRFAKPSDTGFRDINAKIGLENGVSAEFRVEHRGVMEAADLTHEPYERVQEIERRAEIEGRPMTPEERLERQQILDSVRDIHGDPARAAGLDELLSEEGRARLAEHEAERLSPRQTVPDASVDRPAPVPDTPKPPSVAGEFADAAIDAARNGSRLAAAARLGANTPVVGPAVGVGAGVLTHQAHQAQQDYAQRLHEEGVISDEAYEEYVRISQETEVMLQADNALSTADPTGISIVATAGAEYTARYRFKKWADDYAPDLTEEQYQALAMNTFAGNSARTEMLLEGADKLPDNPQEVPESLRPLVEANNELKQLENEHYQKTISGHYGRTELDEIQEKIDAAENRVIEEMESVMADPAKVDDLLNQVPVDERLEYVRSLAQSEADPDFAQNHPEIAAYVEEYDESWTGMFLENDDALVENPELLNDYIKSRSGIETVRTAEVEAEVSAPEVDVAEVEIEVETPSFAGGDAAYVGDPEMAALAAEAGIDVDPAIIEATQQPDPTTVTPDYTSQRYFQPS